MPIIVAWIAHCCQVISLYFGHHKMFPQQSEFPQWVESPAISCNDFTLFAEAENPALLPRQNFIILPPSLSEAADEQK